MLGICIGQPCLAGDLQKPALAEKGIKLIIKVFLNYIMYRIGLPLWSCLSLWFGGKFRMCWLNPKLC
jgi:hypothetical protein